MTEEEERRWDEQRLIAHLLSSPGAEDDSSTLAAASHILARSLAAVIQDREFWDKLRQADVDVRKAVDGHLALLVQVPWAQVLEDCGYVPPPRADDVAHELTRDVEALVHARQNGATPDGAVNDLRTGLEELVGRLNRELATPQPERNGAWRRRLRHLAGVGLEVLRHVNLARLAWTAAEAAVAGLLPAAAAAGPGFPIVVAAVAVGSIAAAASAQLREALKQLHAEENGAGVDAVVNTMNGILSGLDQEISHRQTRDHQIKLEARPRPAAIGGEAVPAMPAHEVMKRRIEAFRNLERQVGTLLPSAWVYCTAQAGEQGRRLIEAASEANAALHAAITACEAAAHKGATADVGGPFGQVESAAQTLAANVRDLCTLLVNLNVASTAAR